MERRAMSMIYEIPTARSQGAIEVFFFTFHISQHHNILTVSYRGASHRRDKYCFQLTPVPYSTVRVYEV